MPRRQPRVTRTAVPGGRSPFLVLMQQVSTIGRATVFLVALALVAIVGQALAPTGVKTNPSNQSASGDRSGQDQDQSPSSRTPGQSAVPAAPATVLTSAVTKVTLSELGVLARREYGVRKVAKPIVRTSRMDKRQSWAFGTTVIPPPSGKAAAEPESSLFIGQATGGTWKVGLAGTKGFSTILRKVPASVVSSGERTALTRFAAAKVKGGRTGLMLPWTQGQDRKLAETPVSPGVFTFATGGDRKVRAAGDGWLYRLCTAQSDHELVLLLHRNGLVSEYSRLARLTQARDGGYVKRGTYLGSAGTGEPCSTKKAPAPSVRFAVRNATRTLAANGLEIGGWTFRQKGKTVSAEQGKVKVKIGDPLENLGTVVPSVPSSPGKSDNPTPSPHSSHLLPTPLVSPNV